MRRVRILSIYKRPYFACSQSSGPSPLSYGKDTHSKLVSSTLSTPRGDKYYNDRPLCEVCPRDRGKVVGTLRHEVITSCAKRQLSHASSRLERNHHNVPERSMFHAREPLYSNSTINTWWLQSMSAQNRVTIVLPRSYDHAYICLFVNIEIKT